MEKILQKIGSEKKPKDWDLILKIMLLAEHCTSIVLNLQILLNLQHGVISSAKFKKVATSSIKYGANTTLTIVLK